MPRRSARRVRAALARRPRWRTVQPPRAPFLSKLSASANHQIRSFERRHGLDRGRIALALSQWAGWARCRRADRWRHGWQFSPPLRRRPGAAGVPAHSTEQTSSAPVLVDTCAPGRSLPRRDGARSFRACGNALVAPANRVVTPRREAGTKWRQDVVEIRGHGQSRTAHRSQSPEPSGMPFEQAMPDSLPGVAPCNERHSVLAALPGAGNSDARRRLASYLEGSCIRCRRPWNRRDRQGRGVRPRALVLAALARFGPRCRPHPNGRNACKGYEGAVPLRHITPLRTGAHPKQDPLTTRW